MSMHLAGPWLSTTSTRKRAEKLTKSKQAELEQGWRDRNVRLRDMGLPKETFEQYLEWVYGRGSNSKTKKTDGKSTKATTTAKKSTNTQANKNHRKQENAVEVTKPKSLGLWVTGAVSSKPSPMYTGTKIVGIGTMHKSNAVPVFSDEEAKDISRMRR